MEVKTELSLLDKLKSWKRWMAVLGAVLPILVQGITGELGWPVAIATAVVALVAGILGLAKEDAARLQAAGVAIAGAFEKEKSEASPPEEKKSDE
jgi:hypothetical protein